MAINYTFWIFHNDSFTNDWVIVIPKFGLLPIFSIKYVSLVQTGQNQNFEMAVTQSFVEPSNFKYAK